MTKRAVVVGAGIGGLTSALALSRMGYSVVIVERDDTPMPGDVEGAFAWDRRGAPQVRHTHGFPALIRVILRDRFPDVLAALLDAGVSEVSILPPSLPTTAASYERDAEDLQVLSCRRTTLEWVLRRGALAEPSVELRVGVGAAGLLGSRHAEAMPQSSALRGQAHVARSGLAALGGPLGPRLAALDSGSGGPIDVRGVRLEDGSEIAADVVVACMGRRCAVPRWFAEHGVEIAEEEHPTGTVYLSRFYRAGADAPMGYVGGRRAGLGFVIAGADHGTYSATLAVDADDDELRAHLLDPDRFQAVLPLFREMEPVVSRGGEPITPVQAMGGLINRIRRFVDADSAPVAHGFFAVGDSHTCTNPVYGRGSSLAVLQATLVADALAAHPDDRDAAARAYEAASAARVEPWYDVSVMTDAAAAAAKQRAADASPAASPEPTKAARLDLQTLRRLAGADDPELAVLVARTMSLLLTPQEVFGDPDVLERLATAAAKPRPPRPDRPARRPLTRADLLAAGT